MTSISSTNKPDRDHGANITPPYGSGTERDKPIVNNTLQPGMMKGPNAPLLPVDVLVKEVVPSKWNNIPVPLVEAVQRLIDCCAEFKRLTF